MLTGKWLCGASDACSCVEPCVEPDIVLCMVPVLGACMQECVVLLVGHDLTSACIVCGMHGVTVLLCTGCVLLGGLRADCLLRAPVCTLETKQGQCRAPAHVVRVRLFFFEAVSGCAL
jgi:hypothetical protein